MEYEQLVSQVHETPHRGVIAITGGGTEVLGELLRHGNGSKTLLEAVVPYDTAAFDRFLGGVPEKYCTKKAACQLAMASYLRANSFQVAPIFGVGATCSLAKDNEREGRVHHIYVAAQADQRLLCYSSELPQGRTRQNEEKLAASFILYAVSKICGIEDKELHDEISHNNLCSFDLELKGFSLESQKFASISMTAEHVLEPQPLVFPGSFNPLHEGHLSMAEAAHKFTGHNISLELSLHNYEKPILDMAEVSNRIDQIKQKISGKNFVKNLILTDAPLFVDKSKLFHEKTIFIVGTDTLRRTEQHNGMNFLVFPRIENGIIRSIGTGTHEKIQEIPEEFYTPLDISSRKIRQTT